MDSTRQNDRKSLGLQSARTFGCQNCRTVVAAGSKQLSACGGCVSTRYCSRACQKDDWSCHKLICKSLAGVHERAVEVAKGGAPGTSDKSNMKSNRAAVLDWYNASGILLHRVSFLAWKHRRESPIIMVFAPSLSEDSGPTVTVEMHPRTEWEDAQWGEPDVVIPARLTFGHSSFHADVTFVVALSITSIDSGAPCAFLMSGSFPSHIPHVHPSVLMTLTAEDYAAEVRRRNHNCKGALYVRLKGLCGATHLNGREGQLKGKDPNNPERWTVHLLHSGKEVGVRGQNFEDVGHSKLFESEF
uniref:MYND-type domain-containing protein n=1 Tax=Mantoniella antarctica TaxID=81844 RepID=A0A7S0T3Y8_9CHLO|mmetsp:Transcript_8877/g.21834  ORF Transcript_8877/g.21834 Transcript_8877/m.21834 type:complete len:301 (+) Transcript_8877:360-1262(+)